MKHKLLWVLGGAAAAIGVYELVFAPYHVPASFAGFNVVAGQYTAAAAPATGKTAGSFAFILPNGARWSLAARTPAPGSPQVAVPLPSHLAAPLLVQGLTAGQGIMLAWIDASGAQQATVYVFT